MVIRPALPEDNEALCRMELLAPQGTAIRLTEHRRDFAARAAQLPGSTLLVAADEKTGSLIGVLGGAPVRIRVGGRERTGGLLFDLRANPEYERGMSRALYLMWQELEKSLRGAGVEFMYGLVKEDNPALSIYHRLGGKERSRRKYWTLPVYRRLPAPPEVEAARRIDAAADYREASQWYRDYDLWPLLDEPASLQPLYDRCLWGVLSCRGASLKIWDASADYERVVTSMPPIYRLLRAITGPLGLIVPLPRVPRPGEPVRTWFIYDIRLPGDPGLLRPLLAAANNLALAENVDYLVVSAAPGEAELKAAGRGALITLDYLLLVKEYEGCDPVPELSPRFYLDIRMI